MCVAFWTLNHPNYALILCSNRDEYLNRPTRSAAFHSFGHEAESAQGNGSVLSGLDEQAGGTWFGLNRSGKVALLTNITEPPQEFSSSRGNLVSSFLLSDVSSFSSSSSSSTLATEIPRIYPRTAKYAGFNLLVLAPEPDLSGSLQFDALLVTNGGAGGDISSRPLSPEERACGGLSNGIDGQGATEWPKVKEGVREFASVLQALPPDFKETELTDILFQLLTLSTGRVSERSELRNTIHVEPFPIPIRKEGSPSPPLFYGTRLSTVLFIRRDGQVLFIERDLWRTDGGKLTKGDPSMQRVFRFRLDRPQSMS